jgi:hypothetical protein
VVLCHSFHLAQALACSESSEQSMWPCVFPRGAQPAHVAQGSTDQPETLRFTRKVVWGEVEKAPASRFLRLG